MLNEFGLLDIGQNRMVEARQHYDEALKIDRQLAQQNPAVYLPDLGMMLDNLGRVDRLQNRIEKSHSHYTEASTIYRTRAEGDPARYATNIERVEASLHELD